MADEADRNSPFHTYKNIDDPYLRVGFLRNPDGSFLRPECPSGILAETTPLSSYANSPILAKDIPINQSNNVWIRVFLPRNLLESSPNTTRLPLIIFFHGGGFIHQSADLKIYDDIYRSAVLDTPAVLVSVNYRLAPEHRLPAAYDDGMEVLHWAKNSQDEWLSKYADIPKIYIMGGSAGANIAYQIGLRAASMIENLKPLNIKGLILHQPFFGGNKRTQSEVRFAEDKCIPLWCTDTMWEIALPVGADRDHEYCNPIMGVKSDQFDQIKALRWKILITGQGGDPLSDRQIEFLKMLQKKGVEAVGKFSEGGYHGDECDDPSKCIELCKQVKEFVTSSMGAW